VTEPPPLPPEVVKASAVPNVPDVDETISDACEAVLKVKVTVGLVPASYPPPAAIVALIRQVPKLDAVIVAVFEEFESTQLVAVPPAAIAYVIAPLPRLSVVLIERACEYG